MYRKIMCSEKFPEKSGNYDTDKGTLFYHEGRFEDFKNEREFPEYWYEEIFVEEKIEKMARQYSAGYHNEKEIQDAFISGYICKTIYR